MELKLRCRWCGKQYADWARLWSHEGHCKKRNEMIPFWDDRFLFLIIAMAVLLAVVAVVLIYKMS